MAQTDISKNFGFERVYEDAHASGLLPGVVLLASSLEGDFKYSKNIGVRSLKNTAQGDAKPLQEDTILGLASCTKLMTAIAVLQCVEQGKLDLDADVAPILPEVGKHGIIVGFDDTLKQPIIVPRKNHITLRHLLTHTSGQSYDLMIPLLGTWRQSRGEIPWSGGTVEEKSMQPLMFEPGTNWIYGGGIDWAGKAVERVTGETLETYMAKNIWRPLGMEDVTFWPKKNPGIKDRIADLSIIGPGGKATDCPWWDLTFGATDCIGGGGAFGSADTYMKLLEAVLREEAKLLKPGSYTELFRPQLNEQCQQALNDLLLNDQQMQDMLGTNVPTSARKNWCLAGLLLEEELDGWAHKGTILWGGLPCIVWLIDREAGLCALAASQILPPMAPPILSLHKGFQQGIYKIYQASEK